MKTIKLLIHINFDKDENNTINSIYVKIDREEKKTESLNEY
jgi:hypothetical protein